MAIISIIDDNTSILTSLSLQFQSKGYKTITFADPEKALLYHEDKPADAYVIDMKMPKLTGFEFYRDLCTVLNKDKVPALFLTAVDNLEERDPDLAEDIRQLMFVFDDLVKIDDRGIQELIKAISTEKC